jgi:hypothetical protein
MNFFMFGLVWLIVDYIQPARRDWQAVLQFTLRLL